MANNLNKTSKTFIHNHVIIAVVYYLINELNVVLK